MPASFTGVTTGGMRVPTSTAECSVAVGAVTSTMAELAASDLGQRPRGGGVDPIGHRKIAAVGREPLGRALGGSGHDRSSLDTVCFS